MDVIALSGVDDVPFYQTPLAKGIAWAGAIVGTATGAYHGYKRNHGSAGWAIGWGLLGGAFWLVTIPISIAQGFGKEKK